MRRWTDRAVALFGLLLAICVPATVSVAALAPQPEPVPTRWEFDMKPGALRYTVVRTADGAETPVCRYRIYKFDVITINRGQLAWGVIAQVSVEREKLL